MAWVVIAFGCTRRTANLPRLISTFGRVINDHFSCIVLESTFVDATLLFITAAATSNDTGRLKLSVHQLLPQFVFAVPCPMCIVL